MSRYRNAFEAGLRRAVQIVVDGATKWRVQYPTGEASRERSAINCAAGWINDEIRRLGADPEPVDVIAENARLRAAIDEHVRRVDREKLAELAQELFAATEGAERAAGGRGVDRDSYVAGYLETTTRGVAIRMLNAIGRTDDASVLLAKQEEISRARKDADKERANA